MGEIVAFLKTAEGIAATAAVVSAGASEVRGSRAEKLQKEQAKLDQFTQREKAAKERRAQIRRRLAAEGQIANIAAQTGGTGGTAAEGSIASVRQQAATNIGAIGTRVTTQNLQTNLQSDLFKTQAPSTLENLAGLTGRTASLFIDKK